MKRHGLDDIGVQCPLGEEIGPAGIVCFLLKDVDERAADDFALLLRSLTLKFAEKQVGCIPVNQRNIVVIAEQADDLIGLVQAHHTRIDKYAGKLVADCLVEQNGDH